MSIARVILCGEPLMHPELPRIAAAIRKCQIKLDLLTNGILLARHAQVVAESCDVLQVSLDGPPTVHAEVRGRPDAFERLREGVSAVRRHAPRLGIDGRCAVHRLNFRNLRDTVSTARELGLRSISFSGTDLHNEEAFRRQTSLTPAYVDTLLIREDELEVLAEELDRLFTEHEVDFASGFIADSPQDLTRSLLEYYRGVAGGGAIPTPVCNAPWTSAVLEYDGSVRPCFPMHACGNVFSDGGLRGALESEEARELRRTLDVATHPTCLGCVCQTRITERIAAFWRARPADAGWTTAVRS